MNTKEFCHLLPKVELHAHLNGSISSHTLTQLTQKKSEDPTGINNLFATACCLEDYFKLFSLIYRVTDSVEAISYATTAVLEEFANDNVRYLELRTTPRAVESTGMTKDNYVRTVLQAIAQFEQKYSHYENATIVRLILSFDRKSTVENALDTVKLADKYRNQGVVGIDLCGDPSAGHIENFRPVVLLAKELQLPITLHIAEVYKPSESALLLSWEPNRIGHGTHLSKQDCEIIKKHQIPIECCLTSNIKCNTVKSVPEHHFLDWYKAGHPVALCTDDKGVFGCSLSHEYQLACESYQLTLTNLMNISYKTIDYAFCSSETKFQLRKSFREDFKLVFNQLFELDSVY